MVYTIVGKQLADYPKDGKQVKGVRLHCTSPSNRQNFEGLETSSFWCGPAFYDQASVLNLDDQVNLFCDQRGYLDTIMLVKAADAASAPAPEAYETAPSGKK